MLDRISTAGAMLQRDDQMQSLSSQINRITGEISSGRIADPGGQPGGAALYGLHYQADQQAVLQTSITAAGQQMDTLQTAMTSLGSAAGSLVSTASGAANTIGPSLQVVATAAQGTLSQMLGLLNTTSGGAYVFSGHDGGTAPMADAAVPQAAAQSALSAQVTAAGGPLGAGNVAALTAALAGYFNDSAPAGAPGFTGGTFLARDDGKPMQVLAGSGAPVSYDAKADAPAFRDLLQGAATLSLLGAPSGQLDAGARQALLQHGIALLQQGTQEMTTLQGQLGAAQQQLTRAASIQQQAADATATQIAAGEQSDPYANSQQLSALQTQLQATYEITVQISRMSLVNYMP